MVRAFPQMLQISHQVMPKSIVLEVQTGGGWGVHKNPAQTNTKTTQRFIKLVFFMEGN